jgi:hypothetical protein
MEKDMNQLAEGYRQEELTFDPLRANLNAILLTVPIAIIMATPYVVIWRNKYSLVNIKVYIAANKPWLVYSGVIILGIMLIGIVLNELIHGITWARYAREGFKSIRFGVMWKSLTPYCHCKEPLSVRHYIIGGLMPAIVLGFVPFVVSLFVGKLVLLLFGIFFTTAAAGDFMIVYSLRKEKADNLVQDHPSKIGCFVYRKQ